MNNIIKNILVTFLVSVICVTALTASAESNTSDNKPDSTVTQVTESTTKPKDNFRPYYRYIKHKKTVVRNKPSKNGEIVKRLSLGKKVKITASKGNWRKIGKGKWVNKKHLSKKDPTPRYQGVKLLYSGKYNVTKNRLTRSKGEVYYKGHKETWYSQKVLPGKGLKIPGRHVAKDGTIRDKDGYICVGTKWSWKSKGSRIMTSLGPAKVYDTGEIGPNHVDIYTNW